MLNETFLFKGKRANGKGIQLREQISLSAPEPNFTEQRIPGRNGSIVIPDGSYKNRTITAPCYLLSYLLERDIDSINSWLLSDGSYQRFEDTMDQKHFMMARALMGVEKRAAMGLLNPFILEFDAKPQRFLKSGEKAVDVTQSKRITNPTAFPSMPLIEVQGSGENITITINGTPLQIMDLPPNGSITYDAETDTAYSGAENKNNSIIAQDLITLSPGVNQISVSGGGNVTSIKITPRWWEL